MADDVIRLITRGDDWGAFRSGNLAIIDAFRHGILRNASLMVPGPHFSHAVHLVKDEPDLCLGLHVTLTSEWDAPRWGPISPPETVPSLVDSDGCFFHETMDLHRDELNFEEVVREARAQLAVARSFGLDIRYMDEHMGLNWLFRPHDTTRQRVGEVLRELAWQEGLVWHLDVAQTALPFQTLTEVQETLRNLMAGTHLLITHPTYEGQEIQQIVNCENPLPGLVAQVRQNDHYLLCHPEVMKTIQEKQIVLARYDEVK